MGECQPCADIQLGTGTLSENIRSGIVCRIQYTHIIQSLNYFKNFHQQLGFLSINLIKAINCFPYLNKFGCKTKTSLHCKERKRLQAQIICCIVVLRFSENISQRDIETQNYHETMILRLQLYGSPQFLIKNFIENENNTCNAAHGQSQTISYNKQVRHISFSRA